MSELINQLTKGVEANLSIDLPQEGVESLLRNLRKDVVAIIIRELDGRHGWKLVPVEPTEAMLEAWAALALRRIQNAADGVYPTGVGPIDAAGHNYKAMLDASPDPMSD